MAYDPTDFVNDVTPYTAEEADKMGAGIAEAHELVDRFDQLAMDAAGEPNVLRYFNSSGLWGPGLLLSTDMPTYVRQTKSGTTYTPILADAGTLIEFTSATPVTLTLPDPRTGTGVGYRADTWIEFCQYGAGLVTMVAASGVTPTVRGGTLKSAGQGAEWRIRCRGTLAEWVISGDLVA